MKQFSPTATPFKLAPEHYADIKRHMLTLRPTMPSALIINPPFGMLRKRCSSRDFDTSFIRQIREMAVLPDTFVLTADSAIPVADTIRGYHDELGLPTPRLVPITIKQRDLQRCDLTHDIDFDELRANLDGATSAVLIDQYIETGATVKYASELLMAAGVNNLSVIRGSWYLAATNVDMSTMSSPHAEFMARVGQLAAQGCSL